MKRGKFILITSVVLAGIIAPIFFSHKKNARNYRPLLFPESLAKMFDKTEIKQIGIAYRTTSPSENNAGQLKQLLLTDGAGKVYDENDKFVIRDMLNRETKKDFETGRTIVIKGWILSLTEVRQCALLSLTEA